MPTAALLACNVCGKARPCGTPEHDPVVRRKKAYTKSMAFYRTAAWLRCRASMLLYNPVCQRIQEGVRCRKIATVVHHIIAAAEDASLRFSPSNLVAVCAADHQGGQPGETQGYTYAPTHWSILGEESFYEHKPGKHREGPADWIRQSNYVEEKT